MQETKRFAVYVCQNCGEVNEIRTTGMFIPRCQECGEYMEEPDAFVDVFDDGSTQGFFECFNCGHTFGYADAGIEDETGDDIVCPRCTSEEVSRV